ncbi:MAG: response regulator [bacterium]|nr:response regulator [bacterium]
MKTKLKEIMILIVEDEDDQRVRLKYVLESDGYKVDEAHDGEEAVRMLDNRSYDLVITDVKMPGTMDGLDVLRETKKKYENTEVIVVSAYGTVESAVRAMISGAFDYIQKPINMPELRIKIERAINSKEITKRLDAKEVLSSNIKALTEEVNSYRERIVEIQRDAKKLMNILESLGGVVKNMIDRCGK